MLELYYTDNLHDVYKIKYFNYYSLEFVLQVGGDGWVVEGIRGSRVRGNGWVGDG